MKKALLIAAAVATTFVASAASAQPYGGGRGPYGDLDRDGRPNYAERGYDRDRDGRPDHRDRFDNRRGGYSPYRYQRGQRFAHYRSHDYRINDYGRYGYARPPRGYGYYRTDSGDVVMAALATGIIASIIASNNNNRYDYR
ncbi:RcnB family protein [Caulobacter sp. NIBR2454]|uniref:RcnB family protein n=1 Tax=Caulobacter sp. NIBR2454 TaxID=3015996 RepID=UPI0022B6E34A|nr:RcnB family protein [Caulobacter sp. NIBR2454]